MRKFAVCGVVFSGLLFSQAVGAGGDLGTSAPRYLVNSETALTEPNSQPPAAIAESFLRSVAPSLGLTADDLSEIWIAHEYRTEHNGVTHILFRQRFNRIDVHGAAYKINIDRDGRVLSAGGDLMKRPAGPSPAPESGSAALRSVLRSVNPKLDGSYLGAPVKGGSFTRFSRGGFADEVDGKPVWFSVRGNLRSAWLFYVAGENNVSRYAAIADASTHRLLRKIDMTRFFQQTTPPARGLVFERESPQPNPTPGIRVENRPYVQRTLQSFAGDPTASPNGWVAGTQTTGNNVIAGSNPVGRRQITNPTPATAADRNFSFPLELGSGAPSPTNFVDAVTTNLFYWANIAHDQFYRYGFNEAAGNFQQDNLGRGGVGGDAMLAYSQFGVAANAVAATDNAFFTTNQDFEDGSRVSINMFLFPGGNTTAFADGSLDSVIVVHEYTHGVSNRLVDEVSFAFQSAAMGEAWSDYFGLEFTLPDSAPPDGYYVVGEYALQEFGLGFRTRPYTTDFSINPITFGQMGRLAWYGPEVHADGEIWLEALWEARADLMKQFGNRDGRQRMAQLIIDGMKLSPPRPSMVEARDAILLADRTGFKGESQAQLWAAFAKRGLGAAAYSSISDTVTVTESRAVPSNLGTLRFEHANYYMGETVRLILHDGNQTGNTVQIQITTGSGDLESLVLRKKGEAYYATVNMNINGASEKFNSTLDVIPGDFLSAYYLDTNSGSGAKLVETTVPVSASYSMIPQRSASSFVSGRESTLFTVLPGGTQSLNVATRTLPFPFRFFGRDYRTMYVSGDGRISFDFGTYAVGLCNDSVSAAEAPTIAPLWVELAYGGVGQRSENVYYSEGPGSVTVRWAAETVEFGEPVNFSVVLYDDGRIVFQYGEGNTDLVNPVTSGCGPSAPLIGISNGRGTLVQYVGGYDGSANLGGAPSVIIDPPFNYSSFPVVEIESPESGGKYSGVMTVRGIAYDPNDLIARLDLLVDGVPRRAVVPGISRPDFCSSRQIRTCPNVGFQTTIDLSTLGIGAGAHTFQLRATNTRGALKNYPDQPLAFTVEPGQSRLPVGAIEMPVEGADVVAVTPVRGYVYGQDVRIVSVDVIIDGTTYGQAGYGLRRDDICSTLDPRPVNCPNIGFTFSLNSLTGAVPLPNGRHALQVRARDEAGRLTLIPATPLTINVNNASNTPPTGVLLNPGSSQKISGVVKIWGWAWDPDGTVRSVQLRVDGQSRQTLVYGDERAEQCLTLPDVKACPNIGFWGDFDTSVIPNGVHQISVAITDNSGNVTVVPRLTGFGMNVTIEN